MQFKDVKLPSNKRFGIFFSLIFALAFLYFFDNPFEIYESLLLIFSFLLLLISFTVPKILSPLNKSWMFFGFIMGKVVSPIILGFLFFILITPIALFTKLIGRDELKLKKKSKTFWKTKEPTKNYRTFFDNQF